MPDPKIPASPQRFKAPDSPLTASRARQPSTDSPLSASADRFTSHAYDSDDDGDIVLPAAQPTITKSSHRRESSSAALLSDPLQTPASPRTLQRQRRLREYERDDTAQSGLLAGVISFVERNIGESTVLPIRALLVQATCPPVYTRAPCLGTTMSLPRLLCIAFAQFFFSIMNLCVKILVTEVAVPIWELIAVRMSITALGCVIWLRYSGDPHPFLGPPGVRVLLCVRGIVGFFGLFPVYYVLQYLSLSDATTIGFLSPVLVGLFAWLLLKEPYTRLEAIVGCTSLLGTVFIAKPSFLFTPAPRDPSDPLNTVTPEQRTSAVFVALIGVCGAAGAYLIIRVIGKRANATHSILYFSTYSTVVACLYPLIFHSPPVLYLTKRFFILLVPIGVFGFVAQVLLTTGLQRERAGRGTLAVYTHLIFAMVLERIFFNTLPDAWSILGALIIVGGALRVALAKQAPKTAAEQAAEAKAERENAAELVHSDEENDLDDVDAVDAAAVKGRSRSGSGIAAAQGVDLER